ncbi:MAG: hypothetical protein KatS3mg105_3309 [Gemmatales bacterium]|nr:MAG: hypothetical protein KatS3mg105_3309 [Gemmatales bacterium]
MKIPKTRKIEGGRLHDELAAAGLPVVTVRERADEYEVVLADDATQAQIDQANTIIDAHDGRPTDEEKLARVGGLAVAVAIRLSSNWTRLPKAVQDRVQAVLDKHAATGLAELER